jgi:hypothetical protein
MIEDWEKDFTGLNKLSSILPSQVRIYKEAAAASNMRMATKNADRGMVEVWTEDKDHELFWAKIKELRG